MNRSEIVAGVSLAGVFALRMLGLFLILPVFAPHARALAGGDNLALVGFALGAYGLTQALFQIPYGIASDRYGRKPVIVFGLLLFVIGSVVAAMASDLAWITVGRVVQGSGAISAAVTALAADLTREQHRTKVMAMIGSSIGLVFAMSLVAAPLLYAAISLSGMFWLTAVLAAASILVVWRVVPPAPPVQPGVRVPIMTVLRNRDLGRLNFGVLALHLMQTALWVVVPSALVQDAGLPLGEHWKVYLPAVLASFVLMVPAIIAAERHNKVKPVFALAIGLLLVVQLGLYFAGQGLYLLALWLLLFFVGFNILEAMQPSLISRIAPAQAKGTALGIYNTTKSLGLFLGGTLGGWLARQLGVGVLHVACAVLATIWLGLALSMAPLPARAAKLSP